jgi:hypothetical protein
MDDILSIWPCSNANFGIDLQEELKIDLSYFMLLEERLFIGRIRQSLRNGMTYRDCHDISPSMSRSEWPHFELNSRHNGRIDRKRRRKYTRATKS